jgi:prepilin-type N-terminal cleavage/methylation domain-containing protein
MTNRLPNRLRPEPPTSPDARPWLSRRPAHFRRKHDRGFTLLELSIVIFIISVVAALAVPSLKQVQLNARSSAVMNDLRVFTGGLQAYAQARGDWPPGGSAPGELPAGTETYLRQKNWERPTPIGGRYTWALDSLQQGERHRAVIIISNVGNDTVTADRRQLEDIDRKIDDGDLETGNFRLGYRNYPVFVIEH